jgi:hypothetical protein
VEEQQPGDKEEADVDNPGLVPPVDCHVIPIEEKEVQEAEFQAEVVVGREEQQLNLFNYALTLDVHGTATAEECPKRNSPGLITLHEKKNNQTRRTNVSLLICSALYGLTKARKQLFIWQHLP